MFEHDGLQPFQKHGTRRPSLTDAEVEERLADAGRKRSQALSYTVVAAKLTAHACLWTPVQPSPARTTRATPYGRPDVTDRTFPGDGHRDLENVRCNDSTRFPREMRPGASSA